MKSFKSAAKDRTLNARTRVVAAAAAAASWAVEALELRQMLSAALAVSTYNHFMYPFPSGTTIAGADHMALSGNGGTYNAVYDYDYGYTEFGKPAYARNFSFTVRNIGDQPLTVSDIKLPAGFSFAEPFDGETVAPNGSFDFSPRIDTTKVGRVSGLVTIENTATAAPFTFEIGGTVFGASAVSEWGTVHNYTYDDQVGTKTAVDYNGGVVSKPGSRLVGFTLPAGQNSVDFDFSAGAGTTQDLSFTLYKDTGTVGLLSLAERSNAVQLSLETRGNLNPGGADDADGGTVQLGGGHYFIETKITSEYNRASSDFEANADYSIGLVATSLGKPNVAVSVGGAAVASGGSVDFGSVAAGAAAARTFTVTNTGDATLHVSALNLTGNTGFTSTGLSGDVAPGASKVFTVNMVTGTPGGRAANVVITTDDPDTAAYTIHLSGQVAGAPQPDNVRPTVDRLNPSVDKKHKVLTLKVPTALDADGTVARVQFFKDDGDGVFNAKKDKLIGADTSAKKGWAVTVNVSKLAKKVNHVFFARAVDNDGMGGAAKAVTVRLSKSGALVTPTEPAVNIAASVFSAAPVRAATVIGDDLVVWA